MTTKTEQAIKLIEEQGMKVRQAARQVDVSESALHAAMKKRKAQAMGVCECCGQPLKKPLAHPEKI